MQILVVVAIIQMRTLKAEVEKGSMRTAVGHGLVGPKRQENSGGKACDRAPPAPSSERSRGPSSREGGRCASCRKGIGSRFPNRDGDTPRGHGDVNEPRDTGKGPRESCLFFLTAPRIAKPPKTMESTRSEIWSEGWQSASSFEASGAPLFVLENLGEGIVLPSVRTHNRIRSPR